MIKLFFIINSFSMGGGAESLLTTIVNNLNQRKFQIGIMEIIHSDKKVEPINDNIKLFPYYVKENDPLRKQKMYYVYHEWDKVINEYIPNDYDIYISFNYLKPTFLLPKNKLSIAWIHSDLYNLCEETMHEEKELQRKAFKYVNRIIAISDYTKQSILDIYPEYEYKMRLIYNGLDEKLIIEKSKEPTDVKLNQKSILAIGRLDNRKNPIRLLEVFEKFHKRNSEVHLYYLGYGVLEDVLRKSVNEKSLDNFVHFLGYYDNPFPIIAQCKVVAMLSKSEGFPMSLLEAVTLGKPFVSTNIGGAKTLSNNETCGKIIDTDDEAVEALNMLLDADENMISQLCMKSITRFRLKPYIEQIEKLIKDLYTE